MYVCMYIYIWVYIDTDIDINIDNIDIEIDPDTDTDIYIYTHTIDTHIFLCLCRLWFGHSFETAFSMQNSTVRDMPRVPIALMAALKVTVPRMYSFGTW